MPTAIYFRGTKWIPWAARVALTSTLCVSLAACFDSGEPSAEDMREATNKNQHFNQMLRTLAANNPRTNQRPGFSVEDVKRNSRVDKSACAPAQGEPGFVCDYRYGRKLDTGDYNYSPPLKGRFYKVGNEWLVDLH